MARRISVLIGSLRRESINRKLANALMRLAPSDFTFTELKIDDLPLFNQDLEKTPAAPVKRLKDDIAASHGLMFVTPEYNRSLPGVFKNAIDHASRPYGQNAWAGKPAGIIGASIGAIGSAVAQSHLRGVLGYLDVPTLGQPEAYINVGKDFFDADGGIANADTRKFLQGWMDAYVAWVNRLAG